MRWCSLVILLFAQPSIQLQTSSGWTRGQRVELRPALHASTISQHRDAGPVLRAPQLRQRRTVLLCANAARRWSALLVLKVGVLFVMSGLAEIGGEAADPHTSFSNTNRRMRIVQVAGWFGKRCVRAGRGGGARSARSR